MPRRFLLGVQVLGLAVLISLLMHVVFGRRTGAASTPLASTDRLDATSNNAGNDPVSTSSVAMAVPPLSSQNPWRTNKERQKGEENMSEGSETVNDGHLQPDDSEKYEDHEAYMPAHLSELLVRDGIPKQAPGPQSF